jgi:hypothetical protein
MPPVGGRSWWIFLTTKPPIAASAPADTSAIHHRESPGVEVNVKLPELVAVPPGVVTLILPVEAPEGTVAVIWVEDSTVKVAATPLNRTELAPVKSVPVMVTTVSTRPEPGENLAMVGTHGIEKSAVLTAVPRGLVTLISPVEAPEGTVAVIWVEDSTVKVAATPLNRTEVAPMKSVPVMMTEVPFPPQIGVNELRVGGP